MSITSPLRLRLDGNALTSNWRWLAAKSAPADCGAAVKADGYGLGACEVVARLAQVGCRDFFVATWAEAEALKGVVEDKAISVLHGVRDDDMATACVSPARPVLNTLDQIARWRETGRPCDVMVDTGMNRLGIAVADVLGGALEGLRLETLMSHLANADENSPKNGEQLAAFSFLIGKTQAKRLSLANSAGIFLGVDYAFGLTRPGLALYGGRPCNGADEIRQVAFPEAQILQRRQIGKGDSVGYNATFTANREMELAILNLGYADGYLRSFSGGKGTAGNDRFPVIGRVSMDLIIVDVTSEPTLGEGDWVGIDFGIPFASAASGLSQYELLTGFGQRFERIWI